MENLENLVNLEELWINDNEIRNIRRETLAPLSNLRVLWVSSNQIEVIEDSFDDLKQLVRNSPGAPWQHAGA